MSDDSVVETISVSSSHVTITGDQVVIDLISALAVDTEYYILIDGSAFEDLSGNSYTGISDNNIWNFTTVGEANAIDIELVPVLTVSGSDTLSTLPVGITEVPVGQTFYVEVWVTNIDGSTNGITGGYLDFSFDPMLLSGASLSHGGIYTLFPDGNIDNGAGLVDNLGGNALPGVVDMGDDEWVRLGYVEFTAEAEGTMDLMAAAGIDRFARVLEGGIAWDRIQMNVPLVTIDIQGM